MNTIDAVECSVCGSLHRQYSTKPTYVRFEGNVYIGWQGGIIGNNLNDDGKVIRSTFVCRKPECMYELLLKSVYDNETSI